MRLVILALLAAAAAAEPPRLDPEKAKDIRDDTPEAQREWPSAAIGYLLDEAGKPEVGNHTKDLARLDAMPGQLAFVWFSGRVEEMGEEGGMFRGRVALADGARVVFVTRQPPVETVEGNDERKRIADGVVRVRGIFVKRYRAAGAEAPALLVVATNVERAYETRPVRSLEDVGLDVVKDDQEFVSGGGAGDPPSRLYPLALMRLLKLAETEPPPGAIPDELGDALIANPAKARGRVVADTGTVVVEPLRRGFWECAPNDAGVEGYSTGWILSDTQKLLQFVAPGRLAGVGKLKERVRFTGYFYKLKGYHAQNGTIRVAPVVVLTDLAVLR